MKVDLYLRILSNGYIPIIPILAWNILFTSKLPPAYQPQLFNSNIPLAIIVGENIFRSIIFLLPLFFRLNVSSPLGTKGLIIFTSGVVLYFTSWLMLIYAPNAEWGSNILGFVAPAYTPIIWLLGLSLMVDSYYFKFAYSKWHFILPSIAFSIFHISHTLYVYFQNY